MNKLQRSQALEAHLNEYKALRASGLSPERAMHELSYLHPIVRARLQKLIGKLEPST